MRVPSANAKRGAAKAGPTTADRLFIELDHRRISRGAVDTMVEVLGIHVVAGGAWIQVSLSDQRQDGVLLHLPSRATAEQAVAALTAWAGAPTGQRRRVIRVMQLA
jgi:hypothetical protein